MNNYNEIFKSQINTFIKNYPFFQVKTDSNNTYLKGILDIPDDDNIIAGSFSIEIHPTPNYPYAFPKLYEVGGEIPCIADYHKYPDNSCCLTVPAREKLICKNGITLIWFVNNVAIPYFANQLYKKQTGKYLQEYSHGTYGIYEFYVDLLHSSDYNVWLQCFKNSFSKSNSERNGVCYCNSGKKYKKCHYTIERNVRIIGKEQILMDLKYINMI